MSRVWPSFDETLRNRVEELRENAVAWQTRQKRSSPRMH
jgi:hypothetical protein